MAPELYLVGSARLVAPGLKTSRATSRREIAAHHFPGPGRDKRQVDIEGAKRIDLLRIVGPLLARQQISGHNVVAVEGHVFRNRRGGRRLHFLQLMVILAGKAEGVVEIDQLRAEPGAGPSARTPDL